ncbi:hypothetical protein OsI_03884 [Oryza sativa Indica Group]|jgi:hypothetical protein|uniref:Uncharacterized protein n=1 Tax=Oryza sativa subsp. indica TaxID=39946 RepID=A2WVG9_ORYSI|nr:hypothetical protein OsI_03884 [Oryza sativa Indica Group]
MALRLAAVPESAAADLSAAANTLPCISYRDSIRSVAAVVSGGRGPLFQSVDSASSWSSSSYASDCSGHSSGVSAAAAAGFRALTAHELREVARRMVTDGYAQRMVQAFDDAATVEVLEGEVVLRARRRLGPPNPRGAGVTAAGEVGRLLPVVVAAARSGGE